MDIRIEFLHQDRDFFIDIKHSKGKEDVIRIAIGKDFENSDEDWNKIALKTSFRRIKDNNPAFNIGDSERILDLSNSDLELGLYKKNEEELLDITKDVFNPITKDICSNCEENCCEYFYKSFCKKKIHSVLIRYVGSSNRSLLYDNEKFERVIDKLKEEYNYTKENGFLDKNTGCKLPRKYRPVICVCYSCSPLKERIREHFDVKNIQSVKKYFYALKKRLINLRLEHIENETGIFDILNE